MKNNPLINNNVFLVLRSRSGAGKSTFADFLEFMIDSCEIEICTADDYFVGVDGSYNFDASKLDKAHKYCREKAFEAIRHGVRIVVLANTNCGEKEYQPYEEFARQNGYEVVSLVLENLTGTKDIHGLPPETLERQKRKLINSLKL